MLFVLDLADLQVPQAPARAWRRSWTCLMKMWWSTLRWSTKTAASPHPRWNLLWRSGLVRWLSSWPPRRHASHGCWPSWSRASRRVNAERMQLYVLLCNSMQHRFVSLNARECRTDALFCVEHESDRSLFWECSWMWSVCVIMQRSAGSPWHGNNARECNSYAFVCTGMY